MKLIITAFAFAVVSQLLYLPVLAQSGEIGGSKLGEYLGSIVGFINVRLIPFIFAIAFIVFIWGIFQYFIAGGANEEARDKGKQLVMWGIIAFVVMVSVWGIVNLLVGTFGFGGKNAPALPTFEPGGASAPTPTPPSPENPGLNDGSSLFY